MGYCLHVVYCIQQFWATKHGDEHVSGVLKYISVCECVEAILCVFALHRVQRSWALSLRVGLKPDRVLQQVLLKSPAYVCFLTALIYHTINSITFNTTQTHTLVFNLSGSQSFSSCLQRRSADIHKTCTVTQEAEDSVTLSARRWVMKINGQPLGLWSRFCKNH